MIRNIFILLIICLIGYGVGTVAFRSPPAYQPRIMPEFTITDINGTRINTTDLQNKIIIINFWATWCPPCVKEFPDLLTLANNNQEDVVLLMLSSDLNKQTIQTFLEKHNFRDAVKKENIKIALDKNNIGSDLFDVFKLPETLIIDRNGIITDHVIGAKWDIKDMQNTLNDLK